MACERQDEDAKCFIAHGRPLIVRTDGRCKFLNNDREGQGITCRTRGYKTRAEQGSRPVWLAEFCTKRGARIKQWTFYRRDEARIREIKKAILAKV